MIRNTYSDNTVKTFSRQAANYEAADLDPTMSIVVPFTAEDDRETIESKGVNWAGLMRQMNQVFKENIGNTFGSKIRTAVSKSDPLPSQDDLNELVDKYDFSGARISTETGMSEEEKAFRSVLRARLKLFLRAGVFSGDWDPKTGQGSPLVVQTKKEADTDTLPEGKISVEDFDSLLEAAAERAIFEYEDRPYDFSEDPEFELNDDGEVEQYNNVAAITAHAEEIAEAKLAADRAMNAVTASIPAR